MGGASRNFAAVTKFLPRKLIILRILIISRNFCATKIWSYTVVAAVLEHVKLIVAAASTRGNTVLHSALHYSYLISAHLSLLLAFRGCYNYPGRHDHVKFHSLRGRCISDILHTPPIEQSDWLECYNHGTSELQLTNQIAAFVTTIF